MCAKAFFSLFVTNKFYLLFNSILIAFFSLSLHLSFALFIESNKIAAAFAFYTIKFYAIRETFLFRCSIPYRIDSEFYILFPPILLTFLYLLSNCTSASGAPIVFHIGRVSRGCVPCESDVRCCY